MVSSVTVQPEREGLRPGGHPALAEHETVLLDLWAPWCRPCHQPAPILEEIAAEMQGDLVVAKLNVDENPQAHQRFQVQGIPTLLLFHRGELVDRIVGAHRKARLKRRIALHLPEG